MNIQDSIAYFKGVFEADGDPDIELSVGDLPVCVDYNRDFSIFFLIDNGEYFELVQNRHLAIAQIDESRLLEIGIENLGAIAQEIVITENSGLLYFGGNGHLEASMLLVSEIWEEWLIEYCPNGYVAAIPARDILAVCDRKDADGINTLHSIIERIWPAGDHLVSKSLFQYQQGSWHTLQNA